MRNRFLACLPAFSAFAGACDSPSHPDEQVPTEIRIVSGDNQQAVVGNQLANALVVRVTDQDGDPIEGLVVNFQVTSGGGSVLGGSTATNADGVAQERWTLGTVAADSQRVEVRAVDPTTGQAVVLATFRATALPDAPNAIAAVGPAARAGSAGMPLDSLQARVTDRHGNPVPGTTVVWSVLAGGGTISPAQSTTNAQGIAKALWTLGTRLDSIHRAQAAISPATRAEFAATVGIPVGATLTKVSGDGQSATVGQALAQPLVVRLATADGRPIMGATITWSIATGSGAVTPPTSVTDADGRAQTAWTLGPGAGPQGVIAHVEGYSAFFSATATPGAPATFAKVGGDGQTGAAGAPLDSLAVRVTDSSGNPVPGTVVTWTVLSGGGTLSSAQSATDANGVARVRWTLGMRVDSIQSVLASVSSALQLQFNAQATVPSNAQLVAVSGNGQTAPVGTQLAAPVVIKLQLPDGRGIIGAPVTISAGPSSGTLTPTSAVTDASGQVSVTWTMGQQAGPATATAGSPGVASLTLSATASAGAPAAITRMSGNNQNGSATLPLAQPLVVKVTDAFGNPVPGATVDWTSQRPSTFTPNPSTTDGAGLAQTQWTPQQGTQQTATATVNGTGLTATFTGFIAWAPQSVTITTPNGTVLVGDSVDLEVSVIGANGQPLPSAPVRWGGGVNGGVNVDSITGMARAFNYAFGNPALVIARLENRSDTVTLTTAWPRLAELSREGTCGLNAANVVICFANAMPDLPFGTLPVTNYIGASTFVCGVLADGRYACWFNGNPTTFQPNTLNREILAGPCFLDTSGRAYCDGSGYVPGGLTFDSISSGYRHNCALTAADDAYCWGFDQMGQLGSSATTNTCQFGLIQFGPCSPAPLAVEGGLKFVSISAGGEHTCALTAEGDAYCWGSNQFGQLGTPTSPNLCARGAEAPSIPCAQAPVPVQQGGLQFKLIETAAYHTCAITTDNHAYCWGRNNGGQLGNGTLTDSSIPVAVAGGLLFKDIGSIMTIAFADQPLTSALTPDGRVFRWGGGVLTPTQISGQP